MGYSDSPTITFVPQSDAGFYKSFYSPFEVEETIGFDLALRSALMTPGWQELSLKFSFGAINGATDFASGKSKDLYIRRIKAFARLLSARPRRDRRDLDGAATPALVFAQVDGAHGPPPQGLEQPKSADATHVRF